MISQSKGVGTLRFITHELSKIDDDIEQIQGFISKNQIIHMNKTVFFLRQNIVD